MIYKSRIEIGDVSVGYSRILPISTNFSVANIREPGKSTGPYTKTITLPASPELQRKFEYPHNTLIQSQNFNANLSVDAKYYVNEVKVYDGKLQLLDTKIGPDGSINYECSLVGETGNIFLAIAGLYLHDIDFSDLDHTFEYDPALFTPTLGEGYAYGYIDYGVNNGSRVGNIWTFEHLKPLIFEREYLLRIFEEAGYTWTSAYLDSTREKSIVIPDVNAGALQLPASTITNNQFLAGFSVGNSNNQPLTFSSSAWRLTSFSEVMPFDDDSGTGFFDPGGVYSTATFRFTPSVNGRFQITATADINIDLNMPAGAVSAIGAYDMAVQIQKSTNAGSTWTNVGTAGLQSIVGQTSFPAGPHKLLAVLPAQMITQPCIFRVVIGIANVVVLFSDGVNPVTSGTASIDFDYSGTFGAVLSSANLPTGATVVMNDTIPRDVLQLDFLTSIIKEEHLFIEPDKDNPNNYIIEPREDFIIPDISEALDWTKKVDYKKEIKVTPMGELDAKRYIFTRKSDKDYYNTLYESEFKEVYGCEIVDAQSEFAKGEKKIESVFSPTPTASASDITTASGPVDIVAPRLFSMSPDGEVSPLKCNIRRLYWGGLIDCSSHTLITEGYTDPVTTTLTAGGTQITTNQYPFVGHVDHPTEPTVNLDFDNPQRLYWIFPNQTFTDNGRYNERYSKYISEITHRDSKVVTMYFNLTARDIAEFSFRRKIFVKDTYYFVNEIKDYDPHEQKSVPVELLKLKEGTPFTATTGIALNDWTDGGGGGMNNARGGNNMRMSGNYGLGRSFGTNNINNDPNALVIGNNNNVG